MKQMGSVNERGFRFLIGGIGDAAIDRTNRRAFLALKKADAFGAFLRHDVINIFG